ncbi:MAG: carboxypeptidase regulatory-like domain-containing protein [Archangium sp.]
MLRRSPLLIALVMVCASAARAEDEPVRIPRANVSLMGGFAARRGDLRVSEFTQQATTIAGVSPTVLRLKADGWFLPFMGAELDASTDLFATHAVPLKPEQLPAGTDYQAYLASLKPLDRNHGRYDVRLGLGLRYVTSFGLVLSSGVGFAMSRAPTLNYRPDLRDGQHLPFFGPTLRVGVQLYVSKLEVTLGFIGVVGFGSGIFSFEPTGYVGWRFLELGDLGLSAGFEYGALIESTVARASGLPIYEGQAHRFALGVRLSALGPKPPAKPPPPPTNPTSLRVSVFLPDGSPAVGAQVTLDGVAPEPTNAQGERAATVTPGAHEFKVTLTGFRAASVSATAVLGSEQRVRIDLQALTGPGKLSGVVRGAVSKKPVPGAVVIAGDSRLETGDDGVYTFASVGPGPVKVRVEAQGYNAADEVAQVPPEGEATLDVALEALGKGSPATVRGLIRSRAGDALKATVVIKGQNIKVPVNGEGRFVVTIPGGEYFFVISAPGYVSQTKKVTLADGDQAIFHCELQKVSK